MTTYDEWRVTGVWHDRTFKRIYSPKPNGRQSNRGHTEPETAARALAAANPNQWADGPHLHKRTVTVTDWETA
jgi:hypothetical protein